MKDSINNNTSSQNKSLLPFLSILVLFTVLSLLNYPIMATLWRYSFDDGTYSHAYLVPFIVLYLYFTLYENHELQFREKFSWLALALLVFSAYSLFIASTAQITLAYWLATLILLCAAINFVFKFSIKLLFPALYFIFLIPLWGILTIPLQNLSIFAVNALMSLTNIPVFVEDEFVHIPSGVFEIAGGCSGLRYLLTSLAISSLYIFLYLRNIKNIAIFASVAILGALLTNWIRIVLLIIIGHETEMTSDLMTDHNMFGWYLYVPFMLLLFKLGSYITEKENNNVVEKDNSAQQQPHKPNGLILLVLCTLLIISSTGLKQTYILNSSDNSQHDIEQSLKIKPLIYHYSSIDIKIAEPDNINLVYHFDGNKLEGKPTFYDNNLIPKNWHILNTKVINQEQVISIQKGIEKAQLTISYAINGKQIATTGQFKKERLKKALTGEGSTSLQWSFERL
ncbi:exosortase [Colwellia sp. 4_MG-2023]|uniref:exosortase n=1 Tax=unclassified Colwellia TaxID=196834 RepID=UPI0026E17AC1|nr:MULTISPECIES: exosortase [unclassified Colwellia]MDO6506823.1 exosortase [Colwellia sp. 5_MG-2023]MDO6555802.1 exosortase [Colwellia sp. 4_MG-2023]